MWLHASDTVAMTERITLLTVTSRRGLGSEMPQILEVPLRPLITSAIDTLLLLTRDKEAMPVTRREIRFTHAQKTYTESAIRTARHSPSQKGKGGAGVALVF